MAGESSAALGGGLQRDRWIVLMGLVAISALAWAYLIYLAVEMEGAMSMEMANLEREELVFKVLDSPFAEVYGPSTQPVCYTLLGVLRGVAMTLFDKPADGGEVQCAAKGDTCCRFVVSAKAG